MTSIGYYTRNGNAAVLGGLQQLADEHGWEGAAVTYTGPARFERMLQDLREGTVDRIVCYDLTTLTGRRIGNLELLFDAMGDDIPGRILLQVDPLDGYFQEPAMLKFAMRALASLVEFEADMSRHDAARAAEAELAQQDAAADEAEIASLDEDADQ